MRQAGRYMPEYRAVRARHSMLELCSNPELAAQVTLQPIDQLGVDAAILFSDLLLPLVPMGLDLEYVAGDGPVIHNPVRCDGDVDRLRDVDVDESLSHVTAATKIVSQELGSRTPLIVFAGAPFTLASYVIEGGSSRNLVLTKRFMYANPTAWHSLLAKLATVVADQLAALVNAGAHAVQLFDSWVGNLSPGDYREFVLPHSRSVFDRIQQFGVPSIHFGVGTGELLELMGEAGGDVMGLDWRIPLDEGWRRATKATAIQGNLDPVALFAPREHLRARVHDILDRAGGRPGHIFNLGHGIMPETPVDNVKYVVELVHEYEARTE